MPESFKAILITRDADKKQSVGVVDLTEDELMEGDVTVAVEATTVNYKDGLAITGKSPVVRRFPMVPGIDFAGTVTSSDHADWHVGDKVILNGWGVGEVHYGAYAGRARVKGDWLVPLPESMSAADAMAIGTAGYTAMLSVMALERHGISPDRGPVVVTGAAGGVGSVAVAILGKLGYQVIASTGRVSEENYLKDLGAAEIIERSELAGPAKPLGRERWAGGIDVAGSHTLANVLSMTSYGGHGPAGLRRAVHPAGSLSPRDRFSHGAEGAPPRSLAAARRGPRSIQACGVVDEDRVRRDHRSRQCYRRRADSRPRDRRIIILPAKET